MKIFTIIMTFLFCVSLYSQEEENDCVFNNDYKSLTTEWLTDLGKTEFIWNTDTNQAEIYSNKDTVFVSKGGCTHFGILVELRLSNDSHIISDSEYWLSKALNLATEFDFKHYKKMITENNLKRVEANENVVWFEIEDNNTDDNLFYSGIEINMEDKSKVIRLGKYYN